MTLTQEDVILILFMLGHGDSRIRPGKYTAEDALEMERRLKEVVK